MVFTDYFELNLDGKILDLDTVLNEYYYSKRNMDKIEWGQKILLSNTIYMESLKTNTYTRYDERSHTYYNIRVSYIRHYGEIIGLYFPAFRTLIHFYVGSIEHSYCMEDIYDYLKDKIDNYFIIDWRKNND